MFKRKYLKFLVIPIILIALVLGLSGCTSAPATPVASAPTLLDRITVMESQTNSFKLAQTNMETRLATAENNYTKISGTITDLQSQVIKLQTSQSTPANMATAQQITNLDTQITALKAQLDTANKTITTLQTAGTSTQTDVATLKTQVASLLTPTPTPTSSASSSGTGTATNGQVSASIQSTNSYSNIFSTTGGNTSSYSIFQPSVTTHVTGDTQPTGTVLVQASGTTTQQWMTQTMSQQFQLQVINNTGKTISNIQLGLAYVFVQPNGTQVSLPSGTTFSISSMGNPQWTDTGDTQQYTTWATGTTSSILGSLWNFTQAPGTNIYYSTLTITLPTWATGNAPLSISNLSWYAVPILKVVSFTTN